MKTIKSSSNPPKSERILVSALDFDPENPRFPPDIASGPIETLIERFVRDERLLEVVTSIADQGYFEGEPLLVTKHGSKYHVIEGNRRLAALKLLNRQIDVPEGRTSIEDVVENSDHRPNKVPCLVFDDSTEVLRYLGFRHITGIKSWSSLQKARYLKRLKDTFYQGVEGRNLLIRLAREIGSRSDYVGQMLSALNVYERAEKSGFYDVKGLNPDEIDFSVLATGLSYSNIAEYIGLDGRQDMVGEDLSDKHLKNLLTWMFVARENQRSILGESRNLKKLAAIVESHDAINILIKEGNLDAAFQLSKGPAQALNLALKSIEKRLKDAWGWMPLIDKPEPGDDERADNIRKLAADLRNAIRDKNSEEEDD
ncbi:MAG: ParB N-terminal domain-containing protein [Gammaproteobacteria bacterium]|nr:ParB N-terminal domain-containing protein [Gammaproteobacteria bacterium]MBU1969247.1 ParB N-terminal domain-containing protein [Gammaproteobacteria bacterium]